MSLQLSKRLCVLEQLLCCRCQGTEGPSGFGFELTFRLKREPGETNPPTWPATLMQALARYVFQTGKTFFSGFSWDLKLSELDFEVLNLKSQE